MTMAANDKMMLAWRLDGLGGALRFERVPVPTPRPGSVLVRIEASTLMSYMKPYVEGRLPAYQAPAGAFTPGGNGVGVIEAVGRDVWHLAPGRRVVVSALFQSPELVADPARILLGVTAFGGESASIQADWPDGTLAEYALLPAAAVTPVDGLDDVDGVRLAALSRFVVPYGGLVRGRLAAGETVIVNGATGAYGAAAVLLAQAMGAGRVVAAGRNHAKLQTVAQLAGGAVATVALSGDRNADIEALRAAADGAADMALDMISGTDAGSTLATLNALRREGRLVLMGGVSDDLSLPYLQLMLSGLEVIGNFMHPPDAYRMVMTLVRAGRLDLSLFTPRVYPLTDLTPAMAEAATADSLQFIVMR